MKINRWMFFVLGVGFVSTLALVYFYTLQRDFTAKHREFLVTTNKFENLESDLTSLVLKNSLYAYHNQDRISNKIKKLEETYIELEDSEILKDENYQSTKQKLSNLKTDFSNKMRNVEDYQMLNAGIKNSLLFLTRHVEKSGTSLKDLNTPLEYKMVFLNSVQILKRFNDTKQMQDLDYVKNTEFLLHSDSSDTKTKSFIADFNLHSNYLMKNFPLFIKTTKEVLENRLHHDMHSIKEEFSKIALNDFKALDIFALVLFIVFILSLAAIIVLFLKYFKENRKLNIANDSLEHSLTYDQLTDLYNRNALETDLLSVAKPHILLINIDSFKNINDIYGNKIGNRVLKELAKLIKKKVSSVADAKVYRLGADEFGVLFRKMDEADVLKIAKSLESEIANHHFKVGDLGFDILVSIASNNIYPIMENADLALKELKKDYTKRILSYKKSMHLKRSVKENMNTIETIKKAIAEDRIVPFFQPIVNLQNSKIEKYEALVRLRQKDGTFLPPFKFLEVSKKTHYYREITKIMIEKTLAVMKEYPQYRFSINISMIDILDEDIVDILLKALEKNVESSSMFDIELLESENLQDLDSVQEFIHKIKKFGSQILIDDFGSGYSNFSYFSKLDIDIVKIDGSITKEITTSKRKEHMLKSIYEFSKGMQMSNIAEFVETREMAILLKEIGVKYAQGYYFSQPLEKPLESDEVTI